MNTPLISIITVTYNAEKYLELTIQSVIHQTDNDFEYIIVDGGSKDRTVEIIRKYDDKLTYWISEPDKGIYDAMNKGLKEATGDYVWFINAGDLLYASDTVEQVSIQINEHNHPDVLYGETVLIDGKGAVLGMRRLKAPEVLTWKSFKKGMLVCHQSFIVKRELAHEYDLQYTLSSDVDWCIHCMKISNCIQNTHLILSRFLEGGTSSRNKQKAWKERFVIMSKHYGCFATVVAHLYILKRFFLGAKSR